jgi:spore germination protein YaaH
MHTAYRTRPGDHRDDPMHGRTWARRSHLWVRDPTAPPNPRASFGAAVQIREPLPRMRTTVATMVVWVGLAAGCAAQNPNGRSRSEFWAFTAPWDQASAASVARNGSRLQAVVTGWIALDSASARPFVASVYTDTQRLAAPTRRLAIVTSWHNDRFHARPIRTLATRPALLAETARWIAERARRDRYDGLVLDFEELEPRDLDAQLAVTRAIRDSARARGIRLVAVAIPASNATAYPARPLLGVADLVLVMLYDQHWLGSEPGPISEPTWVARSLAARVAEAGGPDRVVAGLPLYGYRWRRGAATEIVSFDDAQRIAAQTATPLRRDSASFTLRAERSPDWDMWVTDVELLRRLVGASERMGIRRFSFWRLGQEDPAMWRALVP